MEKPTFSIRLKREFNGHRAGTVLAGVHCHLDERGRYTYRRDVSQENFPISVVEELD